MQVYAFPEDAVAVPKMDFRNFNYDAYRKSEEAATAALKAHMQKKGWTGPNTGEVYSIPHADSAALYMVIEGPKGSRKFALVHLPYMDAWDSPHSRRVTKTDVLTEIERSKRVRALFAARDNAVA